MAVTMAIRGLDLVQRQIKTILERAEKKDVINEFAEEVQFRLYGHLQEQKFRHRPLSRSYKRRKELKGLDPRILIASGEYVNSIYKRRTTTGFLIGMNQKYGKLAVWLEFGTKRMPARPHWRPTIAWAARRWDLITEKYGKELLK